MSAYVSAVYLRLASIYPGFHMEGKKTLIPGTLKLMTLRFILFSMAAVKHVLSR